MQQEEPNKYLKEITEEKYKYGFTTDVQTEIIPVGLNEDVIRLISAKKNEPEWLLEFRLKAYRHWLTLDMPTWCNSGTTGRRCSFLYAGPRYLTKRSPLIADVCFRQ